MAGQDDGDFGQLSASQWHAAQPLDARTLIMEHIAPGLGGVVALAMFMSPLRAVLAVRASKLLGDLNPLPLVAIIANCASWILYGCIQADVYVILANEPGLMLGIFMAVSCYGFAAPEVRDNMVRAMLFFAAIISGAGITTSLFVEEEDTKALVAGYTAVFVLLCFYAAPLSTMAQVLRTRSSASLYLPSSIMACVNGSLWVAYATAKHDSFIFYPNAFGALCGAIQIALIFIFPHNKSPSPQEAAGEYQPLAPEQGQAQA